MANSRNGSSCSCSAGHYTTVGAAAHACAGVEEVGSFLKTLTSSSVRGAIVVAVMVTSSSRPMDLIPSCCMEVVA